MRCSSLLSGAGPGRNVGRAPKQSQQSPGVEKTELKVQSTEQRRGEGRP